MVAKITGCCKSGRGAKSAIKYAAKEKEKEKIKEENLVYYYDTHDSRGPVLKKYDNYTEKDADNIYKAHMQHRREKLETQKNMTKKITIEMMIPLPKNSSQACGKAAADMIRLVKAETKNSFLAYVHLDKGNPHLHICYLLEKDEFRQRGDYKAFRDKVSTVQQNYKQDYKWGLEPAPYRHDLNLPALRAISAKEPLWTLELVKLFGKIEKEAISKGLYNEADVERYTTKRLKETGWERVYKTDRSGKTYRSDIMYNDKLDRSIGIRRVSAWQSFGEMQQEIASKVFNQILQETQEQEFDDKFPSFDSQDQGPEMDM